MQTQSLPDPNSIEGHDLLEQIAAFIGRYLQCSEHQRAVLALWVLHTHCFTGAQVTPYLAIQSAEKQSGKTLCLQLLSLLCDSPAHTVGFTANSLTRRIDGPISTVLLDEFQATIGTRNRPRSPALRAVLASGFNCGAGYTDAKHERNTFSPKAFAGMGQLPEAIADRSIPIILKPLRRPGEQRSGAQASSPANRFEEQRVQRFNLAQASQDAKLLEEALRDWALETDREFENRPSYSENDFPPNLSPRRCDMIEPLLQLADLIGGPWPTRIREALNAVFLQEEAFELAQSLQLLADIRDCFAYNNFPERLSTSTLLDWMLTRPARPWDAEGPITARAFARLLMPFDIHPRVQRIGSSERARGYQLQQFVELWQTHFGFDPAVVTHNRTLEIAVQPDAADLRAASAASEPKKSESETRLVGGLERSYINKDAGCHAVTDSRAVSVTAQTRLAPPPSAVSSGVRPATPIQVEELLPSLRVEPQTIPLEAIPVTSGTDHRLNPGR